MLGVLIFAALFERILYAKWLMFQVELLFFSGTDRGFVLKTVLSLMCSFLQYSMRVVEVRFREYNAIFQKNNLYSISVLIVK